MSKITYSKSILVSGSDPAEFQEKLDKKLLQLEHEDIEIHFSTAFNEQFNYIEYTALLIPQKK